MDDSSESSHSSSYQDEYWLLKKQYDEVLESNSQMVLRLEEAKLMLFKNTRELQSQNTALMSENMNLRAQKEYLEQGLRKLRSLVGNLKEEMDTQKGSMGRQKSYLDELAYVVKSVAENKDNDLANPETEASTGKENAPFLNPTALQELDKQLRASSIGSYYLPTIEEENCAYDDNHDDAEPFNATRTILRSAPSEQNHEVQVVKIQQGNSKPKGRSISKIGRRGSSIRGKKDAVENEALPTDGKGPGDDKPPPETAGTCYQQTAGESADIIKSTAGKENEQKHETTIASNSNNYMMAGVGPSISGLVELRDSNYHDGSQVLNEKQYNCRDDQLSNKPSETISSGHQSPKVLPDANKNMPPVLARGTDVPQLTPNAIIMKNVATSYQTGGAPPKIRAEKQSESMQNETNMKDKQLVKEMGTLVCRVELVDLLGPAQPIHLYEVNRSSKKQTTALALHLNTNVLSTTRINEVPKLEEDREQSGREKPTDGSRRSTKVLTAQSRACCVNKDAATKTTSECEDKQANDSPKTSETQSSRKTTASVSEISHAEQPKGPLNGPNKTIPKISSSENKKSTSRKNPNMQADASTTKSSESLKFEDCRDQPNGENPASGSRSSTNMTTGLSSTFCMTKDAEMKTFPYCEDMKANHACRIQETQPPSQTRVPTTTISQASELKEPLNGPNDAPAETSCSGNEGNKPKKTPKMQGGDFTTTTSYDSLKQELLRNQQNKENTASGNPSSTNILSSTTRSSADQANAAPRIQDYQLSREIEEQVSEILQAREPNDQLNEPNETPVETQCFVNKDGKPRKTQNIQGDAHSAENKTGQALLPLARKSKYAETTKSFIYGNLLTPVRNPSTSAARTASERDDVSSNLAITPAEDDSVTRSISRKNATFGKSKPYFLSPSMEDFRVSTGRILRQSQTANSLSGEGRVSVASSQGESCYSDFTTPKKVKRQRAYGLPQKELVSLLTESAAFQGELGCAVTQQTGIVTRARSKPRRNNEVNYNMSSPPENEESNGDFEFKPPGRRPRRRARK